jgi:hypothetical protein
VTKAYADASPGVTNGSDAAAGQIGEVISNNVVSPGVTLATGTAVNITSISLTAGDWDISAEIWLTVGTGAVSGMQAGLGVVSATVPSVSAINTSRIALNVSGGLTASAGLVQSLRPCRASLSAPTTYYLTVLAVFPSGTTTAYGNIWARRAR